MELTEIKKTMSRRLKVTYNGLEYYISGVTMRIGDGKWYYQVELHDLKANSVTVVRLEDVKEKEENK